MSHVLSTDFSSLFGRFLFYLLGIFFYMEVYLLYICISVCFSFYFFLRFGYLPLFL